MRYCISLIAAIVDYRQSMHLRKALKVTGDRQCSTEWDECEWVCMQQKTSGGWIISYKVWCECRVLVSTNN